MRSLSTGTVLIAAAVLLLSQQEALRAQAPANPPVPPPNIILPNYNGVPVGPFGGLEASAYAARAYDPSAAWFNPAGLSRVERAQISGSAGAFQSTSVLPEALDSTGGSFQQLPNLVGVAFQASRMTLGVALLTTHAWAQETDAQNIFRNGAVVERFSYTSDSEYSRPVMSLGVGMKTSERMRVGGGLAFSVTRLRSVQSATDRVADPVKLQSVNASERSSGSATQLRALVGVQYDTPRKVQLGLVVRTPAVNVLRDGSVILDGTIDLGAPSAGASVFDSNAQFDSPMPWEIHGGVAYVGDRVQFEVDVQGYTPIDAQLLLSSGEPVLFYQDSGQSAPSITSRTFPGIMTASRGFANVAVGGHMRVTRGGPMRVHFGVATDRSPVAEGDDVFTAIDLMSYTFGLSGQLRGFQFAAGFTRRTGRGDGFQLPTLVNGGSIVTPIEVSSTGFLYSLAYQF